MYKPPVGAGAQAGVLAGGVEAEARVEVGAIYRQMWQSYSGTNLRFSF